MKLRKFKFFSLILAVMFVLNIIPNTSFSAMAENSENEVVLNDGSTWFLDEFLDNEENPYNTFSADNKGGYVLATSAEADCNSKSGFKLMQKKAYPALSSIHNLCIDYRGGTYFGFCMDEKFNSSSSIIFYRTEASNTTSIVMSDGTSDYVVGSFIATRSNLADIGIVNVGESYYMTYRGNVIDANGCSDKEKELVKLENYFPKDYLASDGMLYFFFGAEAFSQAFPVKYVAPDSSDYYSNTYTYLNGDGADRNNPSSMTYYNHADVSLESKENFDQYVMDCGSGLTETALVSPVAAFGEGETETKPFVPYFTYSSSNPEWVGQNWHAILLTNDPYSDDDSQCDWLWFVRVDAGGSPHVIYNGATLAQCINMLFDANNAADDYYGACYEWKFVKTDNGAVQLQVFLNGSQLSFAANLNKVTSDKPIYIKYRCPDVSASPSVNVKLKVQIPKSSSVYDQVSSLKSSIDNLTTSDNDMAESILNNYMSSPLKSSIGYSEKKIISTAWSKLLSPSGKEVDDMAEPYLSSECDWYLDKDQIDLLLNKYSELDNGIANCYVSNSQKIKEMQSYFNQILEPNASNLIVMKKSILGISSLTPQESVVKYDYRKDGTIDIIDLVRAKKLASE